MQRNEPVCSYRSEFRGEEDGADTDLRRGRTYRAVRRRRVRPAGLAAGHRRARRREAGAALHDAETRIAGTHDPAALDRALAGIDIVINCAGPFGDTAPPLIEAAQRAAIPYLDITGESFVAHEIFERYSDSPTLVAPAIGFFGALGDLLASAAMADWREAESVSIAVALDSWRPTRGTRLAGARRAGRRIVFEGRAFTIRDGSTPVPNVDWIFPQPFGRQPMLGEFSTVDVVTIARHLAIVSIDSWINRAPIAQLADPATGGPEAADASGRSGQRFVVEALVRRGGEERRARAAGRDIYAITAPIVAEAAERILREEPRLTGARAAGELFDAADFLAAMAPHCSVDFRASTGSPAPRDAHPAPTPCGA
jgi:short subunit dehydrogenase-like uncharacterized protein